MTDAYDLGKKAYTDGIDRDPLDDQDLKAAIQTKNSAEHHPNSPGAEMTDKQRMLMEQKLLDWKRGWDDAHKAELEK